MRKTYPKITGFPGQAANKVADAGILWGKYSKRRDVEVKNIDLNSRILQRPSEEKYYVEEGTYLGAIEEVGLKELRSDYHPSGKRIAVMIKVKLLDENYVSICEFPTYTWDERGKWYRILKDLDMLPKPGEKINLNDLVGLNVKVAVENVEKKEKKYSNIVNITRIDNSKCNIDLSDL